MDCEVANVGRRINVARVLLSFFGWDVGSGVAQMGCRLAARGTSGGVGDVARVDWYDIAFFATPMHKAQLV